MASWNAPSPAAPPPRRRRRARGSCVTTARMPRPPERLLDAAQVPSPVVDDRDHGARGSYKLPFVDGTPAHARVEPRRLRQRAPDRLEHGLGDVVQVLPVVHGDVKRDLGVEGEGAKEILQEIEIEVGDSRPLDRHVEDEVRPARDVHRRVQQRLVHGEERRAVADDPLLVAERLLERLAETDPHVLHRVVQVHLEVALGVDARGP